MPTQRQTLTPAVPDMRDDKDVVSIFAVVVLYKMRPDDSVTLRTLFLSAAAVDSSVLRLQIFVADNSPSGEPANALPPGVSCKAFPQNPGLAMPYNLAISEAKRGSFDWLLTLDQDTNLPLNFLAKLVDEASLYAKRGRIAGIVPRIVDGETPISPLRFAAGFFPLVLKSGIIGELPRHSTAINSASLLRITALEKVGGYDNRFPLNNSDTALFHRLDAVGYRLAVADNLVVKHELAIMRKADRMKPERYRQLLVDERDFWDMHMGLLGRLERLVRLVGRLFKSIVMREESSFQRLTLAEIKTRLLTRRATRLKDKSLITGRVI